MSPDVLVLLMEQPLAYGVDDVARLLSCSRRHAYRLIEAGTLPIVPDMGARKLVPRVAVEALIARAMESTSAEMQRQAAALEKQADAILRQAARLSGRQSSATSDEPAS